jgi:steroid 5-alpha reductase family enzyme
MGLNVISILLLIHFFFWLAWKQDKFSVMDIAWGLGFVLVALVSYTQNYPTVPKAVLLLMITLWGLRLAWYIFTRSKGHGEDPRYMAYRVQWGQNYLMEGYKKVFLAQGAAMFVISLPIQLGMSSDLERFGHKQILGLAIWAFGFGLEVWADNHLRKFKLNPANKGKLCTNGPWTFVRFPNYLGEMLVWWGVYLYIFNFWSAWTIIGPLTICYSLLKVTGIPLIEKRYLEKPEYREYASRVPRLIPFLGKKLPL